MTDSSQQAVAGPGSSDALTRSLRFLRLSDSTTMRYIVVGGVNAGIGYLIYCLLFLILHRYLHYLVILLLSNIFYMALSFTTNKFIVFKSSRPWLRESIGFYLLFACSIAINYAIMYAAVTYLQLHPLVAQIIASVASAFSSYLGNRFIIFRNSRPVR